MKLRKNRIKGFRVGKHFQRWTDTAQMLKTFRHECKAQTLGVEAAMATALIAFIRAEDIAVDIEREMRRAESCKDFKQRPPL